MVLFTTNTMWLFSQDPWTTSKWSSLNSEKSILTPCNIVHLLLEHYSGNKVEQLFKQIPSTQMIIKWLIVVFHLIVDLKALEHNWFKLFFVSKNRHETIVFDKEQEITKHKDLISYLEHDKHIYLRNLRTVRYRATLLGN